ncbi:uncharacterized protein LOC144456532 [Phascolarctos cinereus]
MEEWRHFHCDLNDFNHWLAEAEQLPPDVHTADGGLNLEKARIHQQEPEGGVSSHLSSFSPLVQTGKDITQKHSSAADACLLDKKLTKICECWDTAGTEGEILRVEDTLSNKRLDLAYHLFGLAPPFTHSFQPGSSSTPHVYWPCRSGQVAPNVGLEVRTSARRTSIEKRFVATPSFSSLMKSPCVLKMTILVIFLLFRGSHGGFQSPDPVALSRALFGSPCDCGGGVHCPSRHLHARSGLRGKDSLPRLPSFYHGLQTQVGMRKEAPSYPSEWWPARALPQ